MKKQKVVICGGGFGGVKAALELVNDNKFEVTLISDNPDFRYYPTLFRTATGGKRMISSIPLDSIFAGKKIQIIQDSVESLDRSAKKITTAKGQVFPFNHLLLALGVKTNYFGILGLDRYSFGIKTIEEAEELKSHLHKQLVDDNKLDLNYVVIGGGPTGVELAGALPGYLKKISKCHGLKSKKVNVTLVEAAPRLLPRMPKDVSRSVARNLRKQGVKVKLNSKVEAETSDALLVNGRKISSHTVIWTAGVTNNPFFAANNFQMARNGKVRTNQFLQAEADIYVAGDNADTPYSGMAQTGLHDGQYIARNLIRKSRFEEPLPYVAKRPIYVFPAGDKWAAVLWGKLRIYGRLGWMLRKAADLLAYKDYEPWHSASKRWMAEADYEDDCSVCEAK